MYLELFDPHLDLVIQNKNRLLGDASKAINSLCYQAATAVQQVKDWGSTRFCGVGDILCSEAGEIKRH